MALPDPEVFERQADTLRALAGDLHRDRTERRRSERITRIALAIAAVLILVDTSALVVILNVQHANRASIKSIERTTGLLDCAFRQAAQPATNDPGEQEARRQALLACLEEKNITLDTKGN